jgi:hypothetical protein
MLVVDLWTIISREMSEVAQVVKLPFWIYEVSGLNIGRESECLMSFTSFCIFIVPDDGPFGPKHVAYF